MNKYVCIFMYKHVVLYEMEHILILLIVKNMLDMSFIIIIIIITIITSRSDLVIPNLF